MFRSLALVAAVALLAAPSAAAHASPLATSPAGGAVLAGPPRAASVTFDSEVRPGPRNAAVDAAGQSVLGGPARVVGGRTLVIPLRAHLARGDYTVRWSVVSEDGHEEEGLIAFGVGLGVPKPVASLTLQGFVTWQRVVMRTLFFLGVLGAAGVVAFVVLVLRPLRLEQELLRLEAGLLFAFMLLAFCGADALTHTANVAGTRFDRSVTTAAVAAGVGCIAAALAPVYARLRYVAWSATGVLLVCPTLAGHSLDANQPRVLAPLADLLHLAGAAVWVGGVVSLTALAGRVPVAARPALTRRFSLVAVEAVGVVAVAGAARALTEVSSVSQLWSTGYGRALLTKSALLALTLGVAWLNRSAFSRGLDGTGRLPALELLLLAGIVVAVGTLTDLKPSRVSTSVPTAGSSSIRPATAGPAEAVHRFVPPSTRRRRSSGG